MQTTPWQDKKKKGQTNRYETEPREDLSARKTPEIRPDLPEQELEKGEAAPASSEYAGLVSKYFNERRKVTDVTDVEDTQYFDHDSFVAKEQQALEKMANPETAAEMHREDMAMAMGDLAGDMARSNPDIEANRTGDARADASSEQRYAMAKKLFMESAEKTYPNVAVDKANFGEQLKRTSERLGWFADASFIPDLKPDELDKLKEGDPKALAEKLDKILFTTGDLLQARARMSFDVGDERKQQQMNGQIAAAGEMLYKLQLLRDELRSEMYGRADTTKKEAGEIEEIRAKLLGPEAAKKDETKMEKKDAAQPEALGERERQTLDDVNGVLEKERKEKSVAEKAGEKFALRDKQAVDAFRAVWKEDADLARRLQGLGDALSERAGQRLEAMTPPNEDLAFELSAKEMYARLRPAERKEFEEAALEEEERQRERPLTAREKEEGPRMAQDLFMDFMRELIEQRAAAK